MNYSSMLDRAFTELPDRPAESATRLSIPDPEGETDGAFTRLTNLSAIADALDRDAQHVHRAIQRELGTNGQFEDGRGRYNGSFSVADFETVLDAYAQEFVVCSECALPDTRLVTEDGVEMLRCEACGAFRPVQQSSGSTSRQVRDTVEEGGTYELEITGTGRKGDGVANRGRYTVFVPGAQEGQTVRAVIENVSGDLAFARLI